MTSNTDIELIRAAGGLLWRDSPRGKEILVIHRARYGDWTLPKGKLRDGERWREAAVREVREETGYDARIGDFAGIVSYMHGDRPKVVVFWNMIPGRQHKQPTRESDSAKEVDDMQWLTVQEALARLEYPGERALIADNPRQTSRGSSFRSCFAQWVARLWRSDSMERLAGSLAAYRVELDHLIEQSKESDKLSKSWADRAHALLKEAEQAVESCDDERGWQCFHAAQRLQLHGLHRLEPESGLRAKAQAILNEASEKLDSWRKKTVEDLLADHGKLKEKLDIRTVYFASELLSERHMNVYRRLGIVRRQFRILGVIAVLSIVAWLLLTSRTVCGLESMSNPQLTVAVVIFGVMGACASGIISLANSSTRTRIPEKLLKSWVTLARPLVGAVAALAVYTFLISGRLDLGEIETGLILAVAFAAGFSERLMIRAVEAVAQ